MNANLLSRKEHVGISPLPDTMSKLKIWLGLFVALFAFALYSQSIYFDYTLDDVAAIQDNTLIKQGFEGIPTLLKTDYWYGYNNDYNKYIRVPQYRPASLVMFAIEWEISPNNPHFGHFINVLLFAITCWLLFLLLCKLFSQREGLVEGKNLVFPFICILFYASHSIHTEVVNNIKSRDEILCFLFAILSILTIIKYSRSNSIFYLFIGGVCYFISLLSKETSIAYLFLTPLILYFFFSQGFKTILSVAIVLFIFTGLYLFIRWQVVKVLTVNPFELPTNNTLYATPEFIKRQATAFYILLRYLALLIFPHPLCYDYSYSQIKILSITDFPAMLGLTIHILLIIYALIKMKDRHILSFAILFYLLTLSPVSNVFLLIGSTMAERFLYMPSLGFCMVLTFLLMKLIKTDRPNIKFNFFKQMLISNSIVFILSFIIIGAYAFKTIVRSMDWKDNITLYRHDVKVSDKSARTHTQYAASLLLFEYPKENNQERQLAILDTSIVELNKAIKIYGNSPADYEFLGYAYELKKDFPKAILYYEKGMVPMRKQDPEKYKHFGYLFLTIGKYEKAIQNLDSALIYFSDSATIHYYVAFAQHKLKNYDRAVIECKKAIDLNPNYIDPYITLGDIYTEIKEYDQALHYFNKAAELDSTDSQNFFNLAWVYHNLGDEKKAQLYLLKANGF